MTKWVVALLLSIGAATWIYLKLMRKTGSNRQSSVMAAIGSGVLIFIVLFIILSFIMS